MWIILLQDIGIFFVKVVKNHQCREVLSINWRNVLEITKDRTFITEDEAKPVFVEFIECRELILGLEHIDLFLIDTDVLMLMALISN